MTGIASALIMFLAWRIDGTKVGWLATPLFAPGLVVGWLVVPGGVHGYHPMLYIRVAIALSFVFVWIVFFVVLRLIEKFVTRRKDYA
jgi:prepilin signal peptidase PulO-like enzyme (type II secretory pathway)